VRADRRGAGLSSSRAAAVARLAAAALPLVALCAGIGAAVAGGAGALAGALAGVAVAAVVLAVVAAYCDRLALSALAARPVSEVEHPELYRLVRELSKGGRLPVPRLFLSPAGQPNSFAVGRNPRTAALCCTAGLLASLDEAELRGVLGHELAHVSGRDILPATVSAGLATVITFPAGAARLLPARPAPGPVSSGLGVVGASLMLVLGPLAALVIRLSVSREREYRADAAGALLAGDPVALASALRKIEAGAVELALAPDARLTSVAHLMIASPFHPEGFGRLFATQPPTGERLRRLEALAGYRR
jgi:heat shock protein HtpX